MRVRDKERLTPADAERQNFFEIGRLSPQAQSWFEAYGRAMDEFHQTMTKAQRRGW